MILQAHSKQPIREVEEALRRAAQRRKASIHSLGHLPRENKSEVLTFALIHPESYSALLAADVRFAALLPSHVALYEEGDSVMLDAVSPVELCLVLDRPDLERLALPIEKMLREILEEAARPHATATAASANPADRWALGATEDQVSMRGTIPQRIDKVGTKVEEIAGTGKHDSPGG